jgi:hypothetical protein
MSSNPRHAKLLCRLPNNTPSTWPKKSRNMDEAVFPKISCAEEPFLGFEKFWGESRAIKFIY